MPMQVLIQTLGMLLQYSICVVSELTAAVKFATSACTLASNLDCRKPWPDADPQR